MPIVFADYRRELMAALQALRVDALAVPREESLLDRSSTSPSTAPSSSLVVSPAKVPMGEIISVDTCRPVPIQPYLDSHKYL